MRKGMLIGVLVLMLAGVLIGGYLWWHSEEQITIGQIIANPQAYDGQVVTVKGRVEKVFSAILVKYYEITDGTGRIAVVTPGPMPQKGSEVEVTGTVRAAFQIGTMSMVVIVQ